MDMDDEDFLNVLLDAVTDTRLQLLTGDEARAGIMLLGDLEPRPVPGRSVPRRVRCGSAWVRLAFPVDAPGAAPA
ncbi:hypothetical protein [Streptomyces sp. NPDC058701]|uniref:hypothetical protein n=1 Tax=Streptomyces sp. NPDC058701 TaxID=3346608 RepID=UPI0036465E93